MKKWFLFAVLVAGIFVFAFVTSTPERRHIPVWQHQASPGPLSNPHAFLEENCAACHTGGKGVETAKCIACHANDQFLLQRTPTAFHANIGTCVECHTEHQGVNKRPVQMNHAALAHIGLKKLKRSAPGSDGEQEAADIVAYIRELGGDPTQLEARQPLGSHPLSNPFITADERTLNCAACHATKDVHRQLFGTDCAACHSTEKWTIPGYQHPSPRSTSCVQCHQAPPSHYMMHFKMISMKIAGQPFANVTQCYQCHQTTSWNDIKGVGWYKHH